MTRDRNLVLVAINQGITAPVILVFGIVNIVISQTNPTCGTGDPPSTGIELVIGLFQLIFGFFGALILIANLWSNNLTKTEVEQFLGLNILYMIAAHAMNVSVAIVGAVYLANYSSNCNYSIWATLYGSMVTAFVLPAVLTLFTGIWLMAHYL